MIPPLKSTRGYQVEKMKRRRATVMQKLAWYRLSEIQKTCYAEQAIAEVNREIQQRLNMTEAELIEWHRRQSRAAETIESFARKLDPAYVPHFGSERRKMKPIEDE